MSAEREKASDVITNILDPQISRLVILRILPKSVKTSDSSFGHVCLRVEVLGCNAEPVPTVKYMPCKLCNLFDIRFSVDIDLKIYFVNSQLMLYHFSHMLHPGYGYAWE